jgi:lipopolysaccharide assembly outer membrane protein LptD (OstA)
MQPPKRSQPKRPTGSEPAPPDEVRLRADVQEGDKSHWRGRGFVDVRAGDVRIQADRVDFYQSEKPDGTVSRRLVAESNVVFMRGEERLAGSRAEFDVDTGRGVFEEAVGFVEPGVFVEARRIERIDGKTYRVEGAKFTSCSQPNPRWKFQASSATIHVDDKITATNVLFRVKSVPAFYVPFIYYPIREDQRSTGFLFPHFGYSDLRGYNVGSGFFWAMGRSLDQTLYADHYSRFGYGLGHEFRFVGAPPSRGVFRTYVLKPQGGGPWDWDLDYNAYLMLPGKVATSLQVRQYSDLLFQQQFQDNLKEATTRTRRSSLSLQRSVGSLAFQGVADDVDVFYGGDTTYVNRHLPSVSLRRFPKRVGRTGIVFGFETRGDNVEFGLEDELQRFYRLDFAPELSRPLSTSFLQLTPRAAVRYTRYSASILDPAGDTRLLGPPLDRVFFEGSVDMRGPTFARVFNRPEGSRPDKIKHVIGPEVNWTYRTRVEEFTFIPKFDGYDYYLGTNQINYSLVQRFLTRRRGPGGRPVAYEFLTWRVGQTYYVQIRDGQNNFDPNYSSSSYGPTGPAHFSPLLSRLRFRPTPQAALDSNLEYDVNFNHVRNLGLFGTWSGGRASLQAGWSKVFRLAADSPITTQSNNLRAGVTYQLLPGRLTLDGGADYDLLLKRFLTSRARLRWDVQCCGFVVEAYQFNYNQRTERQFRFALELANVGSIGNFLGPEAAARGLGLGSYR